ncbi:MAG: 1-(5-phosphoribosyl)-5-[(5-phosphoribosylamino)methylideneamino] imidazole-4-carboxamide isomerase [Deltaproteobacteria bacterium]
MRPGNMDSATVFGEHPAKQALEWQSRGASRIHVVDLEGSVGGRPANFDCVKEIVGAVRVPVQVGGGIRDENTIRLYLDAGVSNVIVGTIAAKDPQLVIHLLSLFPRALSIGIDARSGVVAVEGWTESAKMTALDLAARFESENVASFIYTDIERDGMMLGPNIAATKEFARNTSRPVILSGGISSLDDVRKALPLGQEGVTGIIIGRALYEGAIKLEDAIRLAERQNARQENHSVS